MVLVPVFVPDRVSVPVAAALMAPRFKRLVDEVELAVKVSLPSRASAELMVSVAVDVSVMPPLADMTIFPPLSV